MSKFKKLSQINNDIELLETAGKFAEADVLHKKFIKEAQYAFPQMMPMMMPQMMMPQMMMPQMMMPQMMARPTVPVAPVAVPRPMVTPQTAPVQNNTVKPDSASLGKNQGTTPGTPPVTPPGTPPVTPPVNPPGAPPVNPPGTGTNKDFYGPPPPMPIDDSQRQYGDGQSKNEELQYLQNEKQRLERLGYNDPKSPFYQQYLTIIGMINRNLGGSVIRKN